MDEIRARIQLVNKTYLWVLPNLKSKYTHRKTKLRIYNNHQTYGILQQRGVDINLGHNKDTARRKFSSATTRCMKSLVRWKSQL